MNKAIKTIAVIILCGISCFFLVLYVKTFVISRAENEETGNNNGSNTYLSGGKNDQSDDDNRIDDDTNVDVISPIYRSTLPRTYSQNHGNINNLGGYQDDYAYQSFKVGSKIYVICETSSDSCDFSSGSKSNIGIGLFDSECTLLNVITLKTDEEEHYLASSLSEEGIVVVVSGNDKTFIYLIDFELKVQKMTLNIKGNSALSLYTAQGNVVVILSDNTIYVSNLSGAIVNHTVSFASEGVTSLVGFFRMGDYLLFANADGFSLCFSFNMDGLNKSVKLPLIADFVPTSEGFLLAEENEGAIYLNRYSTTLELLSRKYICDGKGVGLAVCRSGYFVLIMCESYTCSYYLCSHFDTVAYVSEGYEKISKIEEITVYNDSVYIACTSKKGLLYRYDLDGHYVDRVSEREKGTFVNIYIDSYIYVLYNSTLYVGDNSSCFGKTDIWLKRENLV